MIFDKQKIKEKVWEKLPMHYTLGDICYLTVAECQKQEDEKIFWLNSIVSKEIKKRENLSCHIAGEKMLNAGILNILIDVESWINEVFGK